MLYSGISLLYKSSLWIFQSLIIIYIQIGKEDDAWDGNAASDNVSSGWVEVVTDFIDCGNGKVVVW